MGGTIDPKEFAKFATEYSARQFIRDMALNYGDLSKIPEGVWVEALTSWHLSYDTPRPVYEDIEKNG